MKVRSVGSTENLSAQISGSPFFVRRCRTITFQNSGTRLLVKMT
ncbi:hypothetical protein FKM82_000125 [Ascaphus truei]